MDVHAAMVSTLHGVNGDLLWGMERLVLCAAASPRMCEDAPMQRVVRLVTVADVREDVDIGGIFVSARHEAMVKDGSPLLPLDDRGWTEAPRGAGEERGARRISVSARHEAVLEDGRRLLLLDDRGWTEELRGAGANGIDDLWALTPETVIVETARVVVGPDEPYRGRTQGDMETDHWNALAETVRAHGVLADASELRQLPHDVVLSDRLRARLVQGSGDAA